jgi:acyl-lipid omega-6 desaturase (Delta-12 desaturase)
MGTAAAVTEQEVRTGAALVRATKPYAQEDRATTWRLWTTTVLAHFACLAVVVFVPILPVQLFASLIAGLVLVRVFIFFHDYLHGALWKGSTAGKAIMTVVGLYMLNPPSVWKETHDYHHQNNAKLIGASIGSFPVATTRMWAFMSDSQRRMYTFARHPLTILFGYFTVFIAGMCIASFVRQPKRHWQGPAALVVHFGIVALLAVTLGPLQAVLLVMFPAFVAFASGSYLFYAQHNFPGIQLKDRRKWSYNFAALSSSSMFDMGPVMHWFTGNIGYHHVHHLNHNIPFYRLPEAMAEMPELQSPGRTSWKPSDVYACLRLKLWDAKKQEMVGWDALA